MMRRTVYLFFAFAGKKFRCQKFFEKWGKNLKAIAYNGAGTVLDLSDFVHLSENTVYE